MKEVKSNQYSWPFLEPVNPDEVVDYYEVIKEPMDLKTIGQRLENGFYRTKEIFCADFKKMFDNCKFYNDPKTEYYECSVKLEDYFKNKIKNV